MKIKPKKNVLLVSQHLWGTGHLVRTAAIASAIAKKPGYSVTHISGGPPVSSFVSDDAVDFIQLPSVEPVAILSTDKQISSDPDTSLSELRRQRVAITKSILAKKHYDAVVTEFFPFEPRRMMDIAEQIISELTRSSNHRTRFICSIRDIPLDRGHERDFNTEVVTSKYLRSIYDVVWHHTDPEVVDSSMIPGLDETLVGTNVVTTGYVLASSKQEYLATKQDSFRVLITVGGGRDGREIIIPVLLELLEFIPHQVAEVHIVCGSLMSDEDVAHVQSVASNQDKVYVYKEVNDLGQLMARCSAVISMAGYNTVVEAVALKRPLLLVPRIGLLEQEMRAEAFSKAGATIVYWRSSKRSNGLAKAIQELLHFQPKSLVDTNGAERSAQLLLEIMED